METSTVVKSGETLSVQSNLVGMGGKRKIELAEVQPTDNGKISTAENEAESADTPKTMNASSPKSLKLNTSPVEQESVANNTSTNNFRIIRIEEEPDCEIPNCQTAVCPHVDSVEAVDDVEEIQNEVEANAGNLVTMPEVVQPSYVVQTVPALDVPALAVVQYLNQLEQPELAVAQPNLDGDADIIRLNPAEIAQVFPFLPGQYALMEMPGGGNFWGAKFRRSNWCAV